MNVEKKVEITLKDLYTYLLVHNRYGYTRNNHLEPSVAFDDCKKFIPIMYEIDADYALHTVKQLCEECISELNMHFWFGIDDENHNRPRYIGFIEYCLEFLRNNQEQQTRNRYNLETFEKIGEETFYANWPYNLDVYERNLQRDNERRYIIYDNTTNELLVDREHALSANEFLQYIYRRHVTEEQENAAQPVTLTYNYRYICEHYDKSAKTYKPYHVPKVIHLYRIHDDKASVCNYRVERIILPEDNIDPAELGWENGVKVEDFYN